VICLDFTGKPVKVAEVLNFTRKSVEAARLRGVVRIALSSPSWRGPGKGNLGARETLRETGLWLALVAGKG
jgi:hypothetical protein